MYSGSKVLRITWHTLVTTDLNSFHLNVFCREGASFWLVASDITVPGNTRGLPARHELAEIKDLWSKRKAPFIRYSVSQQPRSSSLPICDKNLRYSYCSIFYITRLLKRKSVRDARGEDETTRMDRTTSRQRQASRTPVGRSRKRHL